MAGLAAAFALGSAPAAGAATIDASGHHSAATTAAPQAGVSAELLVSVTGQPATGPVIRLDADQIAAMQPKGKHHRTPQAKYVVKSGDTLASIAQHLYHSSNYWTVLYWANHREIKYANEIQAGQVLTVPAKPAKIPGAPATLAPAPAPAPATSTASSGESYQAASTAAPAAAPVQQESSYSGSGGSFQACVIAAESGGNSQVMNGSGHYGLYQFSASTWAEYGGNPAEFGDASVAEQNQVFDNAIAAGGASNWSLYDGC
jgi:nucleoid-associated protein YgaU